MRVLSALSAVCALSMAGACAYSHDDRLAVMPSAPLPAGTMKTKKHGRQCVAQAKRAALKLRRQKAHRMHCRGRRS